MDTITTQGMHMPKLGLGTWKLKGAEGTAAVVQALALGYRHIDTAEMYGNEDAVGDALAQGGVPREQVHLTSKVWMDHLAPDDMQRAIEGSLARLRTPYVDLYLVHWPAPGMDVAATMAALVRLHEQGLARAIGVSNFTVALLRQALATGAPIACNQVEYHVMLDQTPLLAACRAAGMALSAYSPLAQGRLAGHEELQAIAAKHGATPAQVALKWLLDQDGVAAIPKAMRAETQQANLDALRIVLDDTDRAVIAMLPKTRRFVNPAWAPAWDVAA